MLIRHPEAFSDGTTHTSSWHNCYLYISQVYCVNKTTSIHLGMDNIECSRVDQMLATQVSAPRPSLHNNTYTMMRASDWGVNVLTPYTRVVLHISPVLEI